MTKGLYIIKVIAKDLLYFYNTSFTFVQYTDWSKISGWVKENVSHPCFRTKKTEKSVPPPPHQKKNSFFSCFVNGESIIHFDCLCFLMIRAWNHHHLIPLILQVLPHMMMVLPKTHQRCHLLTMIPPPLHHQRPPETHPPAFYSNCLPYPISYL